MLSQMADRAGGLAAFISRGDDFRQQATAFRRKLTRPAATDLKLTFEGGEVYDVTPQVLPNLYHGAPLRIYGRYQKPGSVRVKLEGSVMGGPFEHVSELRLPRQQLDNPQIERMWAYQQVDALLRQARDRGDHNSQSPEIQKVIRLCEEYSIVSEYASFIVLENDAEYRRWKIERKNANRIERDRSARDRVAKKLAQLRDRALDDMGPAVASNENQSTSKAEDMLSQLPPPSDVATTPNQPRNSNPSFEPGFAQPQSGGGGGGGAIDPITGLLLTGFAGASALAARRRRKKA